MQLVAMGDDSLLCSPLQSYLEAFQFGTAVYTDLWTHLQMARSPVSPLLLSV